MKIAMTSVIAAPSGHRQRMHRHDEPRLVLFLRGEMREDTFEGATIFAAGDFLYRPPFFAHADLAGIEGTYYTRLEVSPTEQRRWQTRFGWRSARGHFDLDAALTGEGLLATAFPVDYSNAAATALDVAARALAREPSLQVAGLAKRTGMAPHQFTRAFARRIGVTPVAYRRHARLHRVIRMICESGANLAHVAADAGFHDQSHLTREVRRETGHTPNELRALAGG